MVIAVLAACGGRSPAPTTPIANATSAPLRLEDPVWQVGLVTQRQITEKKVFTENGKENQVNKRATLRSTVLAVADGVVTKVSVTYEHYAEEGGLGQGAAITGETFIVERLGDELVITKEAGEVEDQARRVVAEGHRGLGRRNRLFFTLTARSWQLGDSAVADAEIGKVTVTLVGNDSKHARFRVAGRNAEGEIESEIALDVHDSRFGSIRSKVKLTQSSSATVIGERFESVTAIK